MAGHGVSRRKFIALAASAAAAPAVLPGCGSGEKSETADFGEGEIGALNLLLTLEHVESALYEELGERDFFQGSAREAVRKFGQEERQHVERLAETIEQMGGEPVQQPKTEFSLESPKPSLELAAEVENLGAAAYLGQVPNFETDAALSLALSIHSVEGRHAAAVNSLLGRPITPDGAFAKPVNAARVLRTINPFILG